LAAIRLLFIIMTRTFKTLLNVSFHVLALSNADSKMRPRRWSIVLALCRQMVNCASKVIEVGVSFLRSFALVMGELGEVSDRRNWPICRRGRLLSSGLWCVSMGECFVRSALKCGQVLFWPWDELDNRTRYSNAQRPYPGSYFGKKGSFRRSVMKWQPTHLPTEEIKFGTIYKLSALVAVFLQRIFVL